MNDSRAALGPLADQAREHQLQVVGIGPGGTVEQPAAAAHDARHVGEAPVGVVERALEIIDQHWPGQLVARHHVACVGQLLIGAREMRVPLARVSLTGVHEDERHAVLGIARGHSLESWRRQPAEGSRDRAELDHAGPAAPVSRQTHRVAASGVDQLRGRGALADRENVGERVEVGHVHVERKFG